MSKIIAHIISFIGSVPIFLIACFLFILSSKIFYALIFSFILSSIFIMLLRLIFTKERPSKSTFEHRLARMHVGGKRLAALRHYYEMLEKRKFASSHVARIVLFSFVLSSFSMINNFQAIILLLIALVVGFSRVYLQRHSLLDVVTGFLVGILSSYLVLRFVYNLAFLIPKIF